MRSPQLLAALAGLASASPVDRAQTPFGPSPPSSTAAELGLITSAAMEALLDKYAPIIKLSEVEAFYPSSIEYMLPHYTFIESPDGGHMPANATLLTPPLLDRLPEQGKDQFLSIPEDHNPQPFLDPDAIYLFGPAGQAGGMKRRKDGRGAVEEDIYGFWVDRGKDVVDLWYWTFYPFNFGKPIGPFGVLGNHVGDWEHLMVRTINGTAVSADYHSHNGGAFSSGTTRWSDVPQIEGRPVAYSAAGSHGLWPVPGDHVFANVLGFRLVDLTDDDGAVWDTKDHVVKARFWDGPEYRRKLHHGGDKAWLNFRGMWGNTGENNCWWHKLVPICQLVDAPPGPNRWFGTTPDCIPSPIAWDMSRYAFDLSARTIRWAAAHAVTAVKVEQMCARPKKKKDDSDDDDDDDGNDGDDDTTARRAVDYIHDETRKEDLEVWAMVGTAPFKVDGRQEVSVLPCHGVQSAVKSYRVSLCQDNGKCTPTSRERKICTYQQGKKGYHFGNAANVDDIDEWMWNLDH